MVSPRISLRFIRATWLVSVRSPDGAKRNPGPALSC